MSIAIPGVTGYATMNQLIANSTATHSRLDRLAEQVSTGLVGVTYAALGTGAPVSLDLRPQVANLQTWQANVDAATGRMAVAQTALSRIQSIAASVYAQLNTADGINPSAVDSVAASARDALGQVAGLLDTQDGGVYVFAGQDSDNAPVPNAGGILASGFYKAINTAVSGLAVGGAAATANATWSIAAPPPAAPPFYATGPSPFSAQLSGTLASAQALRPTVQVGQTQTEFTGIPASANGLIPDSSTATVTLPGGPPSSTGSYMRDVLRALATIGSLTSAQASVPGFQDLVQDTRISLSGAVNAMAQDAGALGDVQSSLTATQRNLADTETALMGQVSSVEDVDMAATLSRLSLVQTQMQASYQLITALNGMSLVNFLPAA